MPSVLTKRNYQNDKTVLGFWLYLMSDIMLFAALFATFMILRHATNGNPTGGELFDLNYALIQTILLLASSYTCAIALVAMNHKRKKHMTGYLLATLVFGAIFLGMEIAEFAKLVGEGYDWGSSAAMSAYFALVGTHGVHISIGLLWGIVLAMVIRRRGITHHLMRKFTLFAIFWHFLDLVWIFVFSIVYLMGAAA